VPTSKPLDLGNPLTLAEARRTMRFRPLTSSLLGAPDRISWDGHQLWYVYGQNRLLVSQLLASGVPIYIKKAAEPGTRITPVIVNGQTGFFRPGTLYMAPTRIVPTSGSASRERSVGARPDAAPGGGLTLAEALRIARSFR
jgi:hypothetical protein